jgi:L-ascorbate metabolism protein UlaG (beta-lactamase superfamily)
MQQAGDNKMRLKLTITLVLFISMFGCLVVAGDENAGQQSDKSETSVKIKWLGQASFMITTSDGTTILLDPADFKDYHIPEGTTADIVTVSHEHMDHNAVEAVSGSPVVLRGTDKNLRHVNSIDTTIGDIRMYTVSSSHDPGHHGLNAVFVFEFDGLRMAHMGDIGTILTDEQIAAIGEVDILMVPVGGKFTITGAEADTIVNQLNVKRLVFPMHFKTEAFDILPHTAEPFLQGKENVRRIESNDMVFEPKESEPKREYVVFLTWKD